MDNNTENKTIEDFKTTIVRLSDVKEIYGDSFDAFIDTAREKGLYDEVPLFGGIIRVARKTLDTYSAFSSYRFCKKAYRFMISTKDVSREYITNFFEEYSERAKENGYELLLSVIDKLDNINKADIIGNLLKAKIDGFLTIEDYIRLTAALQQVPVVDLETLPSYETDREESKDTYSLLASGLIYQSVMDGNGHDKFKLNENGFLLVKYGLQKDVKFTDSNGDVI